MADSDPAPGPRPEPHATAERPWQDSSVPGRPGPADPWQADAGPSRQRPRTRIMRPVEVSRGEDGTVVLRQPVGIPEDADSVELHADQLPLVLAWLREAAGMASEVEEPSRTPSATEPGRDRVRRQLGERLLEARELARSCRRLERASRAEDGPGGPSPLQAIRVTLEWILGESDLRPQDWLLWGESGPEGRE